MSAALNVLFVAPFGLRHKTTVWARTLPLARELVAQGMRCTIVVPPWDSPEDGGVRRNHDGVEVVQVNVEGSLPAIAGRIWREIEMRRPDIVHCIKPRAYAGIAQWMLWQHRRRMGTRRPALMLDLDDWEQAWQEINHYNPLVARFLAWQEEWGIRHADGITVASRWLEAQAQAYAPQTPILYLPNGVEIPAISNRQEAHALPTSNTILYFTRFVEVTPEWFGTMVEGLLQRAPDATLIVAGTPLQAEGDAPFRAAVPESLTEKVVWTGYVKPESMPGVYAASRLAIFPALPTVLQMAKCSVRLATTLLNGVPVIASSVGEQSNYGAEGAAHLVPASIAPVEFAAATNALLRDSDYLRAMVRNARRHLTARYQWSSLAEKLGDFYREVLKNQT